MEYIVFIYFLILFSRLFIISWKSRMEFDSYGHLYYIKCLKEQKSGPFGSITTNVVEAKAWRHPFLYHWMLSVFSIRQLNKINRYINPILDSLYSVSILFFSQVLTNSWQIGFLAGSLYLTTPIWFSSLSIGPRIKSFTPRIVSEFAVNLFFIAMVLPLPTYIQLVLATCIGAFVLLSSKFGIQALLFVSLVSALLMLHLQVLIALLLSIVTSIVVTRGEFIKTLGDQLNHLRWYFLNNLKRRMYISNRNSLKALFLREENDTLPSFLVKVTLRMLASNSFTIVILKLPLILFFIYLYISARGEMLQNHLTYALGLIFSAGIIYLLINIPVLLFLGEAERYLNHVSFFIVFYVAIVAVEMQLLIPLYLLIGYGVVFFVFEYLVYDPFVDRSYRKKIDAVNTSVISFLKNYENQTILCYPFGVVGFWRIMYETNHKVLYPITCKDSFVKKYEARYGNEYPYARIEALGEMHDDFGLNLVIIEKQHIHKIVKNKDWTLVKDFDNVCSVFVHRKTKIIQ